MRASGVTVTDLALRTMRRALPGAALVVAVACVALVGAPFLFLALPYPLLLLAAYLLLGWRAGVRAVEEEPIPPGPRCRSASVPGRRSRSRCS